MKELECYITIYGIELAQYVPHYQDVLNQKYPLLSMYGLEFLLKRDALESRSIRI